jgi:LmbE family N-acetylglucosaminyl deacetylase
MMTSMLAIFAHPDDESMGPGGTLAKYAQAGVRVHLICATRGEAGTVDPALLAAGTTLADLRTRELADAARALGLASLTFLDYRDSGMIGAPDNAHPDSLVSAPLDDLATRIAGHIRRLRPDAVITHDQYGWYGHPDHIRVYQGVLRAYQQLYGVVIDPTNPTHTGGQSHDAPRLYLATLPKLWLKLTVQALRVAGRDPRRLGQNGDIDLVEIASWDTAISARVNVSSHLDAKAEAVRRHASQHALTETRHPLMRHILRALDSTEYFMRAYPPVRAGEPDETELVGLPARTGHFEPVRPAYERLGYVGIAQLP